MNDILGPAATTPGLHTALELAVIAGWGWSVRDLAGPSAPQRFLLLHTASTTFYCVPDSPDGLQYLLHLLHPRAVP